MECIEELAKSDELESEELLDTYYRENTYIPHDEYDFDEF